MSFSLREQIPFLKPGCVVVWHSITAAVTEYAGFAKHV
jgi:hypothetical protein